MQEAAGIANARAVTSKPNTSTGDGRATRVREAEILAASIRAKRRQEHEQSHEGKKKEDTAIARPAMC